MRRALSTLVLLLGCVIGAMVPLGETPVEAQTPTTCIEGDYVIIKRGGTEIMIGFNGKTLVLQGQIGASITLNTAQNWAYGFTVFQGNISSTGSMVVNKETIVPAGSTALTVNPTLGQTFIVIESQCEHSYTAIISKTLNTQGYTLGLKLNWIAKCSGPIGIKVGSTVMPSMVLSPFNANNVTGLLAVVPESFQGDILLSVPGSTTVASIPFSVYTGKWETQYYFGESKDKIEGSWQFDYAGFQNLGPYLSSREWFGMGYTALDQVKNDTSYGPQTTPVVLPLRMGHSSSPEILPHNSFNAAFSCV